MLDKIKNILILFVSLSSMLVACINCDIPVSDAGENKTYYLVKECRSENVSENPFLYSSKYGHCQI